jgi:hypothetical protein
MGEYRAVSRGRRSVRLRFAQRTRERRASGARS